MNYNTQQEWQAVLEKLKKDKNPLYELLQDSGIAEDGDNLNLYIPTEDNKKLAQGKIPKIQAKLPAHWQKKRLNIVVGEPPIKISQSSNKKSVNQPKVRLIPLAVMEKLKSLQSPLQELNSFMNFDFDRHGNELAQGALEAAAIADQTCASLYEQLTEKTKKLADDTITVQFPWRLRVGGIRGFRELLLPVFHTVYGVPYIPSSSLKGAIKAIALQDKSNKSEVERLLGTLDNGIGCVQILDAFPTAPCLSVDMANPQWHWKQNEVKYKSEPHALLSMKQPEFIIGLSRTSRGKNINKLDDVQTVKNWLEKALAAGIGSRVSAGYGRTALSAGLEYSSSHDFQLWTQGIYGADTKNSEFRPVALRGMLRYWFRAIALSLYSPVESKELEAVLFGTIDPKSNEGSIRIAVEWEEGEKNGSDYYPHFYKGKILLESKIQQHLTLIEKILYLSSHIAGIGRGSRRPLHWNSPRMRGCYWELSEKKLLCDPKAWQDLIQQVLNAFSVMKKPQSLLDTSQLSGLNKSTATRPVKHSTISPPVKRPQRTDTADNFDNSNSRLQDVLSNKASIYLVPCLGMKHPDNVHKWSEEGHTESVIGQALKLLYSSPKYKGETRNPGNPEVGGKLGIPSFVIIQSNFPDSGQPYQTVTVFGADHKDRAAFIKDLPEDSIQVWPILFK